MDFDPQALRRGFHWQFRPDTYFSRNTAPPPERMPDAIRDAIGRIHPMLMGGLYLPDFLPGEVEIARVQLESVTGDVISVRARRKGNRIAYRIVDEYEMDYPLTPATSALPLTLAGIVRLIDDANPDPTRDGGLAFGAVKSNCIDGGCHPRELLTFATVTSDFYPELGAWYERFITAWLSQQAAGLEEEDLEEGDEHEEAR